MCAFTHFEMLAIGLMRTLEPPSYTGQGKSKTPVIEKTSDYVIRQNN